MPKKLLEDNGKRLDREKYGISGIFYEGRGLGKRNRRQDKDEGEW